MEISQIRYKNYSFLFEKFKNDVWSKEPEAKERGMLKRFAEAIGLSQAYMSHINTGTKPIGTPMARKFEAKLKLPVGWMDQEHNDKSPAARAEVAAITTDEQNFLESAMELYRADPQLAQTAIMKALVDKLKRG